MLALEALSLRTRESRWGGDAATSRKYVGRSTMVGARWWLVHLDPHGVGGLLHVDPHRRCPRRGHRKGDDLVHELGGPVDGRSGVAGQGFSDELPGAPRRRRGRFQQLDVSCHSVSTPRYSQAPVPSWTEDYPFAPTRVDLHPKFICGRGPGS